MRKIKLDFNKETYEINEIYTENLKSKLEKNKIYFETIVMFCLSFMSIVVTIASVVISYNQLALYKKQTQIIVEQSKPNLIFSGKEIDDTADYIVENYMFENIGGVVQDLSLYMTDDIILHIFTEDNHLHLLDINVNGRFIARSRPIVKGENYLLVEQANNSIFDTATFIQDIQAELGNLIDKYNISFVTSQRVILNYTDSEGNEQIKYYGLLQDKLIEDGELENVYYSCRGNEITYNCITDDKTEILKIVTSRVEQIIQQP